MIIIVHAFLLFWGKKTESAGVCFCFIWEVSNPACTMTYATITHLEKLKYTHLYKLDTTFQNIYMSYEPQTAFTFDITEKEFVIQGFCAPSTAAAAYGTAGFLSRWILLMNQS